MAWIPKYQNRANGREEVPQIHPEFDRITKETFGVLIYQEQVMQISTSMAGYSKGESDVLRKAVGKKKLEILLPALDKLRVGLKENNVSDEVCDQIHEMILPFAGYGLTY